MRSVGTRKRLRIFASDKVYKRILLYRAKKMVYAESLRYPYTSVKDLLFAYVLFALPLVNVLSGFFVYGYLVHAAQAARRRDASLPRFAGGAHLFVDGLKALLIVLAYLVPALLALSLLLIDRSAGMVVAVLLGALAVFVLPAALLAFCDGESFGRAFELRRVFRVSFSSSMLLAWLVAILVGIMYAAGGVILSLFTQVTYVGPYLAVVFAFVLLMLTVTPLFVDAYQKTVAN